MTEDLAEKPAEDWRARLRNAAKVTTLSPLRFSDRQAIDRPQIPKAPVALKNATPYRPSQVLMTMIQSASQRSFASGRKSRTLSEADSQREMVTPENRKNRIVPYMKSGKSRQSLHN